MTETTISVRPSTNGADPDVAVDRISGRDYQQTKHVWGPENTANRVDDVTGQRYPVGGEHLDNLDKRTVSCVATDMGEAGVGSNGTVASALAGRVVTGFCFREITGTGTARVTLRNGVVDGAARILDISIAENECHFEMLPRAIQSAAGVRLVRESGSSNCIVFTAVED